MKTQKRVIVMKRVILLLSALLLTSSVALAVPGSGGWEIYPGAARTHWIQLIRLLGLLIFTLALVPLAWMLLREKIKKYPERMGVLGNSLVIILLGIALAFCSRSVPSAWLYRFMLFFISLVFIPLIRVFFQKWIEQSFKKVQIFWNSLAVLSLGATIVFLFFIPLFFSPNYVVSSVRFSETISWGLPMIILYEGSCVYYFYEDFISKKTRLNPFFIMLVFMYIFTAWTLGYSFARAFFIPVL